MITPLVMLSLMTAPWLAQRTRAAGAIGLGILFIFTGVGHFIQIGPMAQMLPEFVPLRWVWWFTLRESRAGGKLRA